MNDTVPLIATVAIGILGPIVLLLEIATAAVSRGIRSRKQMRLAATGYVVPGLIFLVLSVSEYAGFPRIMGMVGWASVLVTGLVVALRSARQPPRDFSFPLGPMIVVVVGSGLVGLAPQVLPDGLALALSVVGLLVAIAGGLRAYRTMSQSRG